MTNECKYSECADIWERLCDRTQNKVSIVRLECQLKNKYFFLKRKWLCAPHLRNVVEYSCFKYALTIDHLERLVSYIRTLFAVHGSDNHMTSPLWLSFKHASRNSFLHKWLALLSKKSHRRVFLLPMTNHCLVCACNTY